MNKVATWLATDSGIDHLAETFELSEGITGYSLHTGPMVSWRSSYVTQTIQQEP